MKKQIPTVLLAISTAILAVLLYSVKQENATLLAERAAFKQPSTDKTEAGAALASAEDPTETITAKEQSTPQSETARQESSAEAEKKDAERRRVMGSMAKMMMENPTMNKVMEASQRGAVGALYSDLIEYLNLDEDEARYFMDLLMYRQMQNVEAAMKLMGGDLSREERLALMEEMKITGEEVETEMGKFLNNPDDFEEFKFYEKTMGERMMLSQVDAKLAGTDGALSDETYREVLEIMYDERNAFDFTNDLGDQKNMNFSAERFSQDNIDLYVEETIRLGENINARLEQILTPEQMTAYTESGKAMLDMHVAQLHQARQMFGGGE